MCLCIIFIGCMFNRESIQGKWKVVGCVLETEKSSPVGNSAFFWMAHFVQGATITIDDKKWIVQDNTEYPYTLRKDALFLKSDDEEVCYVVGWREDTLSLASKDMTLLLTRQ